MLVGEQTIQMIEMEIPPMPNSPQDMMRAVIANLPAKTGRGFDEWVALTREQAIARQGMSKNGEIVNWLKREYGLGHSTAFIVAAEALKPADYVAPTDEQLIDAQYAGAKAALRPIFERVLAYIKTLGDDVRIETRQSYVAFARAKQFALIQPSTKTRVDLGLVLPGVAPSGRLAASTDFGSGSIDRRVALSTPNDVDAEIEAWLRQAYDHCR
jgi:predicted transport protein